MGIRITCPNCTKQLNVKSFLAGKRGVCPECNSKFDIPAGSQQNVVLEVEESEHTTAVRQSELLHQQPPSPGSFPTTVPMAAPVVAAPLANPPPLDTAMPFAARPDPIADAPHALWHLCSSAGDRYGPVAGDLLRQWIAERRVTPETLVWREGWSDWQRADAVLVEFAAAPAVLAANAAMPGRAAPAAPAAEFPFDAEPLRTRMGRPYQRRSSNMRGLMIALLLLAVLILAPLLGYVLYQQF